MRRVHLRGRQNILKRLLVHGAAFNLSLILRTQLGVGKPRQLQGLYFVFFALYMHIQSGAESDNLAAADFASQSHNPTPLAIVIRQ
jgi:hypothetical protein